MAIGIITPEIYETGGFLDAVVMFHSSANHDEAVCEDPDTFGIARDPNPPGGFGGGPHFCLGTHLARLEPTNLFALLLDRMPDIAPAGEARRLPRSNFINGIKESPVRFAG